MSDRILWQKHFNAWRPVDAAGEECLRGYPQGAIVSMPRPKKTRHSGRHRAFWALMSLVHENLPEHLSARYPSVEALVAAFKLLAGVRTEIVLPDGTHAFMPGSISFAKMDDTAFTAFFDTTTRILAQHFLPGVTDADLRMELEERLGLRRAA